MEVLPNDCIFELMKNLGPANVQFMQVNKRILGIFEQNRAKLEHLCARVAKFKWSCGIGYSIELSNSLYPNKKIFIDTDDFHVWRDSGNGKFPFNRKYDDVNNLLDIWTRVLNRNTKIWYCNTTIKPGMLYSIQMNGLSKIDEYLVCCFDIIKLEKSTWVNGQHAFFYSNILKLSDKLIVLKDTKAEIWRFDYDDYARICKHIFKFSEIPPKIYEIYQAAINLIIKKLGLPGI